jgi:hypothetical protein
LKADKDFDVSPAGWAGHPHRRHPSGHQLRIRIDSSVVVQTHEDGAELPGHHVTLPTNGDSPAKATAPAKRATKATKAVKRPTPINGEGRAGAWRHQA